MGDDIIMKKIAIVTESYVRDTQLFVGNPNDMEGDTTE